MSFATLHRGTLLLATVAMTLLTGCAWAPGALCLDPFIHHRNYRAAKVAWMSYGRGEIGPWGPLCKDFETGWRQGYYDVAGGMDGQRPITPPRRYWAARYQSPAGQKQVEAWFAGYELGAAAAQRDGIGYWAFVPTSLGVPAQEKLEEPGSIGYRVMPDERQNYSLDDRDIPHAEPVRAADPELAPPRPTAPPRRTTPRELPLPTEEPAQLPERTPNRSTEPTVRPDIAAPTETPDPLPTEEAPADELPTDEPPAPSAPDQAPGAGDPFADPFSGDLPETEQSTKTPGDEAPLTPTDPVEADPLQEPSVEEEAPPPSGQEIELEPADPNTGAPAIPRRDITWPPRPTTPRQPGQQAPAEGALPKGLDTDDPLPDLGDGAAVMRRPRPSRPTSVRTLTSRSGSNRLRLAPAEPTQAPRNEVATTARPTSDAAPSRPVEQAVTTASAEEPTEWAPKVQPALHTADSAVGETSAGEAAAEDQDDAAAVVEGLRMFAAPPQPDATSDDSNSETEAADAEEAPLGEDDLFSGLSTLAEGESSPAE